MADPARHTFVEPRKGRQWSKNGRILSNPDEM